MKRIKNLALAVFSFTFILFLASAAWAIDLGDFSLTGSAEGGPLVGKQTGKDARFEEYRDLTHNIPVLSDMELILDSKKNDYYAEFETAKPGFDDQTYRLRTGRYGLIDMEFEWIQFPHLFSQDTARTPYTLNGGGTYTLSSKPSAATATTSCGTSPICQWVNANSHAVDLKLLNNIGKFKVRYTPNPGWTFTGSYWSNDNTGKRAFGTLFGSSPGSFNITELAEPISYQTHNIELGAEYAGKGWSLGLKYNGSLFHNSVSTLIWDNPLNLTGLGANCVDSATFSPATGTGACRGRLDLYPSNQAHTVTLSGTASLPFSTQFMGTASYGWRFQDDAFLPFTINSAICPDQKASSCFPNRRSLGGDMRPLMINATVVNNSIDRLHLKVYERFYDLSNHNKTVVEPNGFINLDTGSFTSPGDPLSPDRFAYSKNNVGMDIGYDFTRWLTGKLTYGWERMHRQDREVSNTDEHTFGPTFDIKPTTSLLIRAAYRHSWRNAPNYLAAEDVDASNVSRKFDEASRQQDKTSLFAQYSPWDRLMVYTGFEFFSNRYGATLGTQNGMNYSPSVGLVYTPLDWLKLFADYNWDRFDWLMNAEDRTSTATQTPANSCFPAVAINLSRCWTARGRDQVHTISLGSDMDLIPNLLGFRIQYGFSIGRSDVNSSGDRQSTTPATNYPPIENVWHELLARFEYRILQNLSLRVGYYFNHANEQDKGVDIMKPWMGDVDIIPTPNANVERSIFLGDKIKGPFTAHLGFIALKVQF